MKTRLFNPGFEISLDIPDDLTVEFDGFAGEIDYIRIYIGPDEAPVDPELAKQFKYHCLLRLGQHNSEWKEESGSYGTFIFCPRTRTIEFEITERTVETSTLTLSRDSA